MAVHLNILRTILDGVMMSAVFNIGVALVWAISSGLIFCSAKKWVAAL